MTSTISTPTAGEYSSLAHAPPADYYDDEPDDEWKAHTKQLIEDSFQPMIQDAKDRLERMMQSVRGHEDKERFQDFFVAVFKGEAAEMKTLAKEEFECALKRERLRRRIERDMAIPDTIMNGDDFTMINGDGLNADTIMNGDDFNPETDFTESLRLDIEQEQAAATLQPGSALENDTNAEAAFQNLIDLSSDSHPSLEPEVELRKKVDELQKEVNGVGPDAGLGALAIKITRLGAEPAVSANVWVSASQVAREQEKARRQRANSKATAAQLPPPPPAEPPKKWVSASEVAARRKRITG